MALKSKYLNPKTYKLKIILLVVFIVADIVFNCFTQYMDFGSTKLMEDYKVENIGGRLGDISFAILS